MERDEGVRTACFLALDVLRAQFGDELPYTGALDRGFAFRGRRIPFLNYFVSTRPGWYEPLYPCYVVEDQPVERRILVTLGRMVGPLDEREPVPIEDSIERRYVAQVVKVRLHQRRFRWLVIPAYREQCAICRLKEVRLLDAAHIVGDPEPTGTPRSRTASASAPSTIALSTRIS